MSIKISEVHRKELLRFLLLKTAAVRGGIKPGELLRVRHCYRSRNAEGFRFCLYRNDILDTLKLDHLILRRESASSLVLFYHRETLRATLACSEVRTVLAGCGYPEEGTVDAWLERLKLRFENEEFPHEIGLFIGYPAKDVAGFIADLPRTPVHRGAWQVFGAPLESLRRMELYRRTEQLAQGVLDVSEDLQTFFDRITHINLQERRIAHG